jgi:4,5-dihydroxyphthalate decarboxylase
MTSTNKAMLTLRTNLAESKITHALRAGVIGSDLVRFDFCGPDPAHEGFRPMVREGAFDAGELALATFLQARQYGKSYSLIPVVVSGRFQQTSIGYNADFGELGPKDLEGRRVGVRSYTQTTGLWVRGLLSHEYGVDLDRITWVCTEGAHLAEFPDPPGVDRAPEGSKSLGQMLLDGDVAAVMLGAEAMPKRPGIRPLIPEPEKAAQAWYAKYRCVPINHLFVVNSTLAKQRPDVVREVYRMLSESKRLAGPPPEIDNLAFGFEANRKAIELGIEYALEQKIISRRFSVDELYADAADALDA